MRVARQRPPPPLAGTPLARMQERVVLLDPHSPCIPRHLSLLVMLFYFLLFACTTRCSFLLSLPRESRHRPHCFLPQSLLPLLQFAIYVDTHCLPFFSHFFPCFPLVRVIHARPYSLRQHCGNRSASTKTLLSVRSSLFSL